MNILYIMRYWPVYGGGETITATLANEFVQRGYGVHIAYTYNNMCEPMPYLLDKRIKSIKLQTIENYTKHDVVLLHKYILENEIDAMINQWGNTSLCAQAKEATNCKLFTCWHLDVLRDAPNKLGGRQKFLRRLLRRSLYNKYYRSQQLKAHRRNYVLSNRYIFLSPSFVSEYLNESGLNDSENKLCSISNPLTYDFLYDMALYQLKKKQVLFVGRILEYHKRISYVLRIWKKIESDKSLNDWNLVIVGDGPDMKSIRDLAMSLNLNRVSFEGFKNPRKYYEESSVFMMTSAFEGFGMTLVEAQQYACVPMAMDTYGSLHDIIINEENGLIIPDNDIDGYVLALKSLMLDTLTRQRLAIGGLQSCKRFSKQAICNQWEELFCQM